jgi:hypothetical protein
MASSTTTPTTRSWSPTWTVARRATMLVSHAMSSTRPPLPGLARSISSSAHGAKNAGTRNRSYARGLVQHGVIGRDHHALVGAYPDGMTFSSPSTGTGPGLPFRDDRRYRAARCHRTGTAPGRRAGDAGAAMASANSGGGPQPVLARPDSSRCGRGPGLAAGGAGSACRADRSRIWFSSPAGRRVGRSSSSAAF